mgnify:CR=1 FL=1
MLLPIRPLTAVAVQQLATVDYTVANRVTDDVAHLVQWAYHHGLPGVASAAVHLLQQLDAVGSVLIALVVWLVEHTA